jgi:multidrug resistance efflux pump
VRLFIYKARQEKKKLKKSVQSLHSLKKAVHLQSQKGTTKKNEKMDFRKLTIERLNQLIAINESKTLQYAKTFGDKSTEELAKVKEQLNKAINWKLNNE